MKTEIPVTENAIIINTTTTEEIKKEETTTDRIINFRSKSQNSQKSMQMDFRSSKKNKGKNPRIIRRGTGTTTTGTEAIEVAIIGEGTTTTRMGMKKEVITVTEETTVEETTTEDTVATEDVAEEAEVVGDTDVVMMTETTETVIEIEEIGEGIGKTESQEMIEKTRNFPTHFNFTYFCS